jgi:hypothetical protein
MSGNSHGGDGSSGLLERLRLTRAPRVPVASVKEGMVGSLGSQLFQQARTSRAHVQQTMQAVASRHAGHIESSSGRPPPARREPPPTPKPAQVVSGPDGSHYPVQAGWCADILPPRVRGRARQRTVGYADGSYNRYTSGEDGTYSPQIRRGLINAGFSPYSAKFLSSHVELKLCHRHDPSTQDGQ